MINSDLNIKDKFVEMCKMIFINADGKFVFPIDNLIHDEDYSNFINHSDWSVLESKMTNLISKVNQDSSILEKDVETEIWEMV
jgi:hypothetical protein